MFRDLRKVAPWFAIFVLAVVVGIGATKAARHCLFDRQFNIRLGASRCAFLGALLRAGGRRAAATGFAEACCVGAW